MNQKFKLLNERRHAGRERAVIIDEAHFLKNESEQTQGTSLLEADFKILLSASPYRDPASFCRIMRRILPDDPKFRNIAAFERAFPKNDPTALRALHLLQLQYIIRFCKTDVLPVCNPALPLEEQQYALPRKERINTLESGIGHFTLTPAQEQAIFELFSDWKAWQEKYGKYIPDNETAKEDRLRNRENQLVKMHALQQIMNNPRYIGSDEPSPKHETFKKILLEELGQNRKVVVFCRYHAQVEAYKLILKKLGIDFTEYTGKITKQGFQKDTDGKEIYIQVDEYGNYLMGTDGMPLPGKKGENSKRIQAMDYERLSFQNNPDKKVMLCTYSAGSVGVTFSAGHTIIEDDLPNDAQEQYQAEDRIHRIDQKRQKYVAKYYSLVSRYSEKFLDRMKKIIFETEHSEDENSEKKKRKISAYESWFRQGTYAEVKYRNLGAQRIVFDIINDGIVVNPALLEEMNIDPLKKGDNGAENGSGNPEIRDEETEEQEEQEPDKVT